MTERPRKDRLIQTRVPQDLESTLKDEARKRRLSVSHLIRNVLEDTFNLVDNVVSEVDRVVTDSVEMAQTLRRDAQRLAATARGETSHREKRPEDESGGPLSAVYAFQELVLNRSVECARCKDTIVRGATGYMGLSEIADAPKVWVCRGCLDVISAIDTEEPQDAEG